MTQTLTYTTNSNRLATHDGNSVTLDAAGNTTADVTEDLAFVYDDHNRMVEAYDGAVLQASYVYNGHGQRQKKVEATGSLRTFVYHYGLSGELLGETLYDQYGARIGEKDYIWLETLPLAQSERVFSGSTITDDLFVYLHADQLETPRLATDSSGTVVWRWDSDAFGVGLADEDPDADTNLVTVSLRFPGQYFGQETGLHYNYFRDYDPATGRYVESDPIGLAGGPNTFVYVVSNPLLSIDPYGLLDVRDIFPEHAPAVTMGEALAAMVAYAVGTVTSDELLCTVAAEDLRTNRAGNVDAFLVLAGGRGGANRSTSRANGIPDRHLGPSGLPKRHTVEHSSRKAAREAAQREVPRGGSIRNDASPTDRRQGRHYQAEDAAGNNVRPVVHHEYPK